MSGVIIERATHLDVLNLVRDSWDTAAGMIVSEQAPDGIRLVAPESEHSQMALLTLEQKAREAGWTVKRE